MDESRFDDLSKRLAAPLARRRMVKGLGGGLVAGLLARAEREPAAAASCPATVRCGHGPTAVCCRNAADVCSRGAICQSATLACPVGGDVSRPSYRCTNAGGFACDCATEIGTGNVVCVVSGGCTACASSADCPAGQLCVAATSCINTGQSACARPCT